MPLERVCSPNPPSGNSPALGGSRLDLEAPVCPQHPQGSPSESLLLHEGCSEDAGRAATCLQQLQSLSGRLLSGPGEPTSGPCGAEAVCLCHPPSAHSSESLCHQLPTKSDLCLAVLTTITWPFSIHMAKREPQEMEHAAVEMAAMPRGSWGRSVSETWAKGPRISRPSWSPGIPNLLGTEVPKKTSTTGGDPSGSGPVGSEEAVRLVRGWRSRSPALLQRSVSQSSHDSPGSWYRLQIFCTEGFKRAVKGSEAFHTLRKQKFWVERVLTPGFPCGVPCPTRLTHGTSAMDPGSQVSKPHGPCSEGPP